MSTTEFVIQPKRTHTRRKLADESALDPYDRTFVAIPQGRLQTHSRGTDHQERRSQPSLDKLPEIGRFTEQSLCGVRDGVPVDSIVRVMAETECFQHGKGFTIG